MISKSISGDAWLDQQTTQDLANVPADINTTVVCISLFRELCFTKKLLSKVAFCALPGVQALD